LYILFFLSFIYTASRPRVLHFFLLKNIRHKKLGELDILQINKDDFFYNLKHNFSFAILIGKNRSTTRYLHFRNGDCGSASVEASVAAAAVVAAAPSTVVAGILVPLAGLGRAVAAVLPPVLIVVPAILRGVVIIVGAAYVARGRVRLLPETLPSGDGVTQVLRVRRHGRLREPAEQPHGHFRIGDLVAVDRIVAPAVDEHLHPHVQIAVGLAGQEACGEHELDVVLVQPVVQGLVEVCQVAEDLHAGVQGCVILPSDVGAVCGGLAARHQDMYILFL
jgi:hypothetical protein